MSFFCPLVNFHSTDTFFFHPCLLLGKTNGIKYFHGLTAIFLWTLILKKFKNWTFFSFGNKAGLFLLPKLCTSFHLQRLGMKTRLPFIGYEPQSHLREDSLPACPVYVQNPLFFVLYQIQWQVLILIILFLSFLPKCQPLRAEKPCQCRPRLYLQHLEWCVLYQGCAQ